MPDLIDELRRHTADLHQRTESAFDLVGACASREAYAALLRAFLGVYAPIETRLDRLDLAAAGISDWPARRRAHLLRKDLAALGAASDVSTDNADTQLPLDDLASAVGCLYVLEGSTLGGQFIRKHVAASLGLDADNGCAFFTGSGAATKANWAAFVAAANVYGQAHPEAVLPAVRAAKACFEFFERALTSRGG